MEKGFGGILGHVAAIIGLGTLLGSILEASGREAQRPVDRACYPRGPPCWEGVGEVLATSPADVGLPVIALSYAISCGMRVAQGSATVAIVTTTGIVVPVVADLDHSRLRRGRAAEPGGVAGASPCGCAHRRPPGPPPARTVHWIR
ncbi:hypothetical protein AB0H12_08305 [Actinosynnema sp. NPDC023794]